MATNIDCIVIKNKLVLLEITQKTACLSEGFLHNQGVKRKISIRDAC